jgi:hypothetical protein
VYDIYSITSMFIDTNTCLRGLFHYWQVHVCSFTNMFLMYDWFMEFVFFFHTKYTKITHYSDTEHIDIPKLNTSTVVHNYHADHNLAKNRYLLSVLFYLFLYGDTLTSNDIRSCQIAFHLQPPQYNWMLLKVVLNTINQTKPFINIHVSFIDIAQIFLILNSALVYPFHVKTTNNNTMHFSERDFLRISLKKVHKKQMNNRGPTYKYNFCHVEASWLEMGRALINSYLYFAQRIIVLTIQKDVSPRRTKALLHGNHIVYMFSSISQDFVGPLLICSLHFDLWHDLKTNIIRC